MIGSLMMCVSPAILLAGIAVGIQQDFALAPAHARFNLIGGGLLFLFGLYQLVPDSPPVDRGPSSHCRRTPLPAVTF